VPSHLLPSSEKKNGTARSVLTGKIADTCSDTSLTGG
jgi:hypothetical protein